MPLKRTIVYFCGVICALMVYVIASFLKIGVLADFLSPVVFMITAVIFIRGAKFARGYSLAWYLIAVGYLAFAAGDVWWAVDDYLTQLDPAEDVPLMYWYFLTNVFLLGSVLYVSFKNRKVWSSLQFFVDEIALCAMIAGFLYYVFFHGDVSSYLRTDHEAISSFLYLVCDLLLISFVVSVMLSLRLVKSLRFFVVFAIGVLVFAVADCFYVYAVFNESFVPNSMIDVGYSLSAAIMGVGAIMHREHPYSPPLDESVADTSRGVINRALVVIFIPVLAILSGRVSMEGIALFAAIVLFHQGISLVIRKLFAREMELDERRREAAYLEATIADRTRELNIMNQTLENLVRRDAITGLFNRKFFMESIDQWMQKASSDEHIWLLIIDCDRFKSINDTYGHDVGDQVLRFIGRRLDGLSNDRTLIARLGGDEFGIAGLRQESEPIQPLLHSINVLNAQAVSVRDFSVRVGMSAGVAVWPSDAKNRSDLMRHADIAMYIAKERGINGVAFFDHSLNAVVERKNQIDIALKQAVIVKEFSVVYQPQVTVGGRKLAGMEALVRWNSPELGFVPPDEFIAIAEENGIILPLSDWILRTSLAQIAAWNARCHGDLAMSINISPLQLEEEDFIQRIDEYVKEYSIKTEWINLEITERCAMKSESFIVRIFDQLAARDISISIDDFGTGYSSLSYLKKFDVDYLKIAKQLVDGVAVNDTDAQIVQAIISMATAMNLKTIAEGVEDEAQFRVLESLGCDEIQGYFFGKPASPSEFEKRYLTGSFEDTLE